jgi:hypothetical protein
MDATKIKIAKVAEAGILSKGSGHQPEAGEQSCL